MMVDDSQTDQSLLAVYRPVRRPDRLSPGAGASGEPAVAAITGLVAKENVVGTFGILYGFAEVAENGWEIWGALSRTASRRLAAYCPSWRSTCSARRASPRWAPSSAR